MRPIDDEKRQMTAKKAVDALERIKAEAADEWIGDWEDYRAFDLAIQALQRSKWIPCSEYQPTEKTGHVIYCDKNGNVGMGLHSEFSDMWYKGDMCGVGGAEVVAWMPLPKPYQE